MLQILTHLRYNMHTFVKSSQGQITVRKNVLVHFKQQNIRCVLQIHITIRKKSYNIESFWIAAHWDDTRTVAYMCSSITARPILIHLRHLRMAGWWPIHLSSLCSEIVNYWSTYRYTEYGVVYVCIAWVIGHADVSFDRLILEGVFSDYFKCMIDCCLRQITLYSVQSLDFHTSA